VEAYAADRSLKGKLRRRWARLAARRPARVGLDRPLLSVSFDDAPASAVDQGARILEDAGARGTFYIAAGLCGREGPMGRFAEAAEIAPLATRGHEIGCHTFSHLDCGKAEPERIARDVDSNAAALVAHGLPAPSAFAYPYGDVSVAAKRVLRGRFRALRALHPGMVRTGSDLNQLPAVGIEGEDGEPTAAAWLERAAARRAWLILYTHDVAEAPSPWGCTPGALRRLLDRARALGFEIRPVGEALDRIGAAA
jgi:peptidoglycan/xylan/chitin deacetylase (PgdA/CDA1 family)